LRRPPSPFPATGFPDAFVAAPVAAPDAFVTVAPVSVVVAPVPFPVFLAPVALAANGTDAAAGAATGAAAVDVDVVVDTAGAAVTADTRRVLLFPFPLLHVITLSFVDISFYYLLPKRNTHRILMTAIPEHQ
jgi:hypothetical protein